MESEQKETNTRTKERKQVGNSSTIHVHLSTRNQLIKY